MTALKRIVDNNDTRYGQAFDLFIQSLIVVSLVTFAVETLPDLPEQLRHWLRVIEVVTVLIFTAEYFLRIWVADHRLRFMLSFFGIVDLLAILPFYVATGIDLRSLRALRLLRLLHTFKIIRYSKSIQRFHRALLIARDELILYFFVTSLLLYFSAVGVYYFEHKAQPEAFASVFHSLWWAVVTLTTVGYGDVYPITLGGRIFTFVILLAGLGIISIPPGLIASAMSKAREMEDIDEEPKS